MIDKKLIKSDWRDGENKAIRDGFGEGVLEIGEKEKRLVVLTADLGGSTRVLGFRDRYPERYYNVGVSEQNLVGVGAGLASEGLIPVVTSFAVFSPGRSWEQLRVSVCYSEANVKVVGSHAGLATGEDGATHQALEDVAITRSLPNLKVLAPCDFNQAKSAVEAMIKMNGAFYMRLPRPKSLDFTKERKFEIGKVYLYRKAKEGKKGVSVFSYGIQVWDVLSVSERLAEEGFEVEVLNVSTIKPLDREVVLRSVKKTGKAVVVEDHQKIGGLGSAVAEVMAEEGEGKLLRIGVEDEFGESGDYRKLYKKYGLDRESLYRKIKRFV